MARKKARNACPLIVESHPADYKGYPFITLIQYSNDQELLGIIDNSNDKTISAFVLDLCGPEKINEEEIIAIASEWYESNNRHQFPLSIEFSRRGLSGLMSKIYRTYTTDFVTRVIGPLPSFQMSEKPKIKRRRRRPIPKGIEINRRTLTDQVNSDPNSLVVLSK